MFSVSLLQKQHLTFLEFTVFYCHSLTVFHCKIYRHFLQCEVLSSDRKQSFYLTVKHFTTCEHQPQAAVICVCISTRFISSHLPALCCKCKALHPQSFSPSVRQRAAPITPCSPPPVSRGNRWLQFIKRPEAEDIHGPDGWPQ